MSKQVHDLTVNYVTHTNSAIKVRYDGDTHWLPISQIEIGDDLDELSLGDKIEISVPDWLAVEKEMV